ncbi:MAG: 4Fe-4S dicluster domain-containing protein [Bacillota bacterium]|nr:4Fe-4S dicluster domain-containing protein [Bacillota bacterium]
MGEDIARIIMEAGIVGAGGAGFPTHVKVAGSTRTIVVNGAECEPLLRVDQQLMEQRSGEIIAGLAAVMEATGAAEGVIALKGKYKGAIANLTKAIHNSVKPITIYILGDFFPAGDEHVTVYEAIGRLVPQGDIPLKVDCIVVNVETLLNVAGALQGKPVTHTYLTIAGAVAAATTLRLPIGTSIKTALALAGVKELNGMRVIEGGPMMGKVVADISQPVTKTTKGLIVLQENHPLVKKKLQPMERIVKQAKAACIQCRVCTDLCPRYLLGHQLEPHRIMRCLNYLDGDEKIIKMSLSCSECGVCEQYACVMGLSPRAVNSKLKKELAAKGITPGVAPEEQKAAKLQSDRKVPLKRLVARLGLSQYDRPAPLTEAEYSISQVALLLKQHVGAPSVPVVGVGHQVKKGDLIAIIPDKSLGANLHASINGFVSQVSDRIVITQDREGRDAP